MQDPLKHMLSAFGGTKAWATNTCQQTSNFMPPDIPLVFTCGLNVTSDSTGDNTQTCSAWEYDDMHKCSALEYAMTGNLAALLNCQLCLTSLVHELYSSENSSQRQRMYRTYSVVHVVQLKCYHLTHEL